MPTNVVQTNLAAYIERFNQVVLSEEELVRIRASIRSLELNESSTAADHVQSLRDRHASEKVCPTCGGSLVKRTTRKKSPGGAEFLGCSRYPKCRFTKPLSDRTYTFKPDDHSYTYKPTGGHASRGLRLFLVLAVIILVLALAQS